MIDSSVKVTVPSTVDVGTPASQIMIDSVVDQVLITLSDLFGGATAIPGRGAYVSDAGDLITENVIVVEALCEKQSAHFQADQVMDLGAQICEAMDQECVLVQIDGVGHFVDESHRLPGLCGTAPMPISTDKAILGIAETRALTELQDKITEAREKIAQ